MSGKKRDDEKTAGALDLKTLSSRLGLAGGAYAGLKGINTALTAGGTLAGLGFLARSKFEERHKDDRDRTIKDKLLSYAPVIGGGAGAVLGLASFGKNFRDTRKLLSPLTDFIKENPEVVKVLNRVDRNMGRHGLGISDHVKLLLPNNFAKITEGLNDEDKAIAAKAIMTTALKGKESIIGKIKDNPLAKAMMAEGDAVFRRDRTINPKSIADIYRGDTYLLKRLSPEEVNTALNTVDKRLGKTLRPEVRDSLTKDKSYLGELKARVESGAAKWNPEAKEYDSVYSGAGSGPKGDFNFTDILGKLNSLSKEGSLKKDVKLKDHQVRAIQRLEENGGSLLVAHATGSGKTLTGIAGFEHLKSKGQATKAVVVVPAALRENFVKNLNQFTNSTHSVYGPKGERKSKDVGDKSSTDYNIISYELFREHGDKILADTGADTLIMDEIHRARGTEGLTYNKIKDLRANFKNAITLTGSVVNNEPNEVVPLMDITYNPTGHKLVSKKFFDKLFVDKQAKNRGIWNPKVSIEKNIKNKKQLGAYMAGKLDYVGHEDLEADMPDKTTEVIRVPMTKEQKKLYDFSMSSVDAITRWKIRNNIPMGQREAKEVFGKLQQARQVSVDPGILDKNLADKNPYDYSPKVKKIVDDAEEHLNSDSRNKTVIYGNLIHGGVGTVEKALQHKGIEYAKFFGQGQEGMTAKKRPEQIKDFISGKKKILLISGAGAEGLDLKDTSMLQMVEGHYNPERIQQAEARIRRLGSFGDRPKEERKIMIKRYLAIPEETGLKKKMNAVLKPFGMTSGNEGIDRWIYTIAERKDALNSQFRDVMKKDAMAKSADADLTDMGGALFVRGAEFYAGRAGDVIGGIPSRVTTGILDKRRDKDIEAKMKQMLLDRGHEELAAQKKHYPKVIAESKLDERALDAGLGAGALVAAMGTGLVSNKTTKNLMDKGILSAANLVRNRAPLGGWAQEQAHNIAKSPFMRRMAVAGVMGGAVGSILPPLRAYIKTKVITNAIEGGSTDLDKGIEKYLEILRKKNDRKYKGSKGFVNEYETRQELGIDTTTM